jgi:imidazoleglycerol phosphate dehydratase HisB
VSIRLEAAIELARSILDGKTDYMHHSEELYKVVAWRIIMAVQKDERAQVKEFAELKQMESAEASGLPSYDPIER